MFAYTGSTLATRASQGEKELHHILKGVGFRQQSDEAQVEALAIPKADSRERKVPGPPAGSCSVGAEDSIVQFRSQHPE